MSGQGGTKNNGRRKRNNRSRSNPIRDYTGVKKPEEGSSQSNSQSLNSLSRYAGGIGDIGSGSTVRDNTGHSSDNSGSGQSDSRNSSDYNIGTKETTGSAQQGSRGGQPQSANDVTELLQLVNEAIQDQRTGQWRNPKYRSPIFSSLVDQLKGNLATMNSIILPPLIKAQLGNVLAPLRAEAERLGDRFFDIAMADLDRGRVDRIDKLLWLSGINQIRLKLAQESMFESVNQYVKEHYASDPADPDASTFFLPSQKEAQLAETWKRVDELIQAGMALIRETIQFNVAGQPHELVIITIAEKPMNTPATSILDIGQ